MEPNFDFNQVVPEEENIVIAPPSAEAITQGEQEVQQIQQDNGAMIPQGSSIPDPIRQGLGWVDEQLGTNLLGKAEVNQDKNQERFKEWDQNMEEVAYSNPANTVLAETVRGVAGGVTDAFESVGEFGELVGDSGRQLLGLNSDPTQNPWDAAYEAADWDFGTSENKTAVGNLGRGLVSFMLMSRGLKAAGLTVGTGANAGRAARMGGEALRGAIADLIYKPGEGNLTNMLEEAVPGLSGTFLTALAHDEDDNIWEARLKNVLEGGITGVALDALGEIIGAVRAGRKAKAAGKKPDQVVDAAVEHLANNKPKGSNAEARMNDAIDNSATPNRPGTADPNNRAVYPDEVPAQKAVEGQYRKPVAGDITQPQAPRMLTEAATNKILSMVPSESAAAVKEVLERTAKGLDVDALAKSLGKDPDEIVREAAGYLTRFLGGESPEAILAASKTVTKDGDQLLSRGGIVAAKGMIADTAQTISNIAYNFEHVVAAGGNPARQATELVDQLEILLKMHKEHSHGAGSILANMRNPKTRKAADALDEVIESMQDLRKKINSGDPAARAEVKALADGIAVAGDNAEGILDLTRLYKGVGVEVMQKAAFNSMLSGPATQMRNIIGNTSVAILRPMAIGIGSNGDAVLKGRSKAMYANFANTLFESVAVGWRSMSQGVSVTDGSKMLLRDADLDARVALLNQKGVGGPGMWMINMLHNINKSPWTTWPTKMLNAADNASKTLIARMELRGQAYEQAMDMVRAGTIDESQVADKALELFDGLAKENFGADGRILKEWMADLTERATFQSPLEGPAARFNDFTNQVPFAKIFAPFVRTGANIMDYSSTYVPVARRFSSEFSQVMKSGDPVRIAEMQGRLAIGQRTAVTGAVLAMSGLMTGNGPQDPARRKVWLKNNQPMSFKVGNTWISYESVEPLNVILAAVADATQLQAYGATESAGQLLSQLGMIIASSVTNRSYWSGLEAASVALDPTQWSERAVVGGVGGFANNMIPWAGLRRQMGQALVPGMTEWRNEYERLLAAALPGYTAAFGVEKTDIFTGERVETGRQGLAALLPFSMKSVQNDPVVQDLSRYGIEINDESITSISGVKLSAEQREQVRQIIFKNDIRGDLKRLFNSAEFKKSYEAWKADPRIAREEAPWYIMVTDLIQDHKSAARETLLQNNVELQDTIYDQRHGYQQNIERLANFHRGS